MSPANKVVILIGYGGHEKIGGRVPSGALGFFVLIKGKKKGGENGVRGSKPSRSGVQVPAPRLVFSMGYPVNPHKDNA